MCREVREIRRRPDNGRKWGGGRDECCIRRSPLSNDRSPAERCSYHAASAAHHASELWRQGIYHGAGEVAYSAMNAVVIYQGKQPDYPTHQEVGHLDLFPEIFANPFRSDFLDPPWLRRN